MKGRAMTDLELRRCWIRVAVARPPGDANGSACTRPHCPLLPLLSTSAGVGAGRLRLNGSSIF